MRRERELPMVNYNQTGSENPNWKGGISKNRYHYKKLQKLRYPEKVRASMRIYHALISGKLVRGVCEVCGLPNAHAHHEDYSKPLEVMWLCRHHHRMFHTFLKKMAIEVPL